MKLIVFQTELLKLVQTRCAFSPSHFDHGQRPARVSPHGLKPHLRSTSIQCYLCLLLNSHFLTEAGIHIFILGCISASLPKTEANWNDVMSDLNAIKNLIQSIHFDATLYTESDAHPSCKVTAMKCFLLELRVIFQETNNKDIRQTIDNLIFLANNSLPSDGNVTESGCKECEQLEEKNIKEFLGSFTHIVQMFINTPSQ